MIEINDGDRERFEAKVQVEPNTGCHLWTAALDRNGYGAFGYTLHGRRQMLGAHRFAVALDGRNPEGMDVDHLCRTRACVNPAHLEVVSHAENNRRSTSPTARNVRKTHCPEGHELVWRGTRRRCPTCARLRARARRAEERAEILQWANDLSLYQEVGS